jgi:hypothetical protein
MVTELPTQDAAFDCAVANVYCQVFPLMFDGAVLPLRGRELKTEI